jgi:hypothetical protein
MFDGNGAIFSNLNRARELLSVWAASPPRFFALLGAGRSFATQELRWAR